MSTHSRWRVNFPRRRLLAKFLILRTKNTTFWLSSSTNMPRSFYQFINQGTGMQDVQKECIPVKMKVREQEGTAKEWLTTRSYSVQTPTGTYHGNRRFLNAMPEQKNNPTPPQDKQKKDFSWRLLEFNVNRGSLYTLLLSSILTSKATWWYYYAFS